MTTATPSRGAATAAWSRGASNQQREVGDGSTVNARLYPVQVITGADGPPLTGVREVEAGYAESYAIMDDGTVRAWGQIRCDGGSSIRIEPFPIALPLVGGDVRQVASGGQWTLFLKKDGTVLSCGTVPPMAGRPVSTSPYEVYVPKPLTGLGPGSGVIDIAAGGEGRPRPQGRRQRLAVGRQRQLGGSACSATPAPPRSPRRRRCRSRPARRWSTSTWTTPATRSLTRADGSVLGWGCDFFEQVGNGPGPGTGVTTPTVISMPGRSAIGLSASGWNSLVLTRPVADPDWERAGHVGRRFGRRRDRR